MHHYIASLSNKKGMKHAIIIQLYGIKQPVTDASLCCITIQQKVYEACNYYTALWNKAAYVTDASLCVSASVGSCRSLMMV